MSPIFFGPATQVLTSSLDSRLNLACAALVKAVAAEEPQRIQHKLRLDLSVFPNFQKYFLLVCFCHFQLKSLAKKIFHGQSLFSEL